MHYSSDSFIKPFIEEERSPTNQYVFVIEENHITEVIIVIKDLEFIEVKKNVFIEKREMIEVLHSIITQQKETETTMFVEKIFWDCPPVKISSPQESRDPC